jgi:hypothetical protein
MKPWRSPKPAVFRASVVPWLAMALFTVVGADVVGTRIVLPFHAWYAFQASLVAAGLGVSVGSVRAAAPGLVSSAVMAVWGAATGMVEQETVAAQYHFVFAAHPALMLDLGLVPRWTEWWTPGPGALLGATIGLALTPMAVVWWKRGRESSHRA